MPESKMKAGQSDSDGKWNDIRSAIRVRWPEITAADLRNMDGDSRKLVALVNQKTRMPLHEIEAAINELAESSGGLLTRLVNTTRTMASDAGRMAGDAGRQIVEPVRSAAKTATQSAGNMVSQSPGGSVAAVFGAGALVGFCITLMLTPSSPPSSFWSTKR